MSMYVELFWGYIYNITVYGLVHELNREKQTICNLFNFLLFFLLPSAFHIPPGHSPCYIHVCGSLVSSLLTATLNSLWQEAQECLQVIAIFPCHVHLFVDRSVKIHTHCQLHIIYMWITLEFHTCLAREMPCPRSHFPHSLGKFLYFAIMASGDTINFPHALQMGTCNGLRLYSRGEGLPIVNRFRVPLYFGLSCTVWYSAI